MYRVLLVEDEATVREGIVQKIDWSAHGFELAGSCENGSQALEVLNEGPVDLVITDINMPVMDGLELARQIQLNFSETVVVLLTGYSEFAYAQAAIKYRVHEYILKPVTARQLRQLLDKLYSELAARDEVPKQVAAMQDAVDSARQVMRRSFLQSFAAGELSSDKWQKGLEQFGIQLNGPPYGVMLVNIRPAIDKSQAEKLIRLALERMGEGILLPEYTTENQLLILYGGVESSWVYQRLEQAALECSLMLLAVAGRALHPHGRAAHEPGGCPGRMGAPLPFNRKQFAQLETGA